MAHCEWLCSNEQLIDEASKGPPFRFLSITITIEYFGWDVFWCSANACIGTITLIIEYSGQPKINKLKVAILVYHNVFGLEVAIQDAL